MAKDAIFALLAGIVVVALALRLARSAGHPPSPTNVITNPRPFWFLIWYFALLALSPPRLKISLSSVSRL